MLVSRNRVHARLEIYPRITAQKILLMDFEVAELALAAGDFEIAKEVLDRIDRYYLLHLRPDPSSSDPLDEHEPRLQLA